MKVLRTPDECFDRLDGFGFAPRYAEISDGDGGRLRVHYLDEGPADADPVLLMHGEPSWCYLYRSMIPPLVAAGHRVVCPDLVGFGRSDKPADVRDYTYARHVTWMSEMLFDVLDLRRVTFFGQDWGGLIGLRLVAADPDRFDRVVIGNTGLPRGDGKLSEAFLAWQRFSRESPRFDVGKIVAGGCSRVLSPAEIAAYDAPFPTEDHKAGARILPSLVPVSADDPAAAANQAAWEVLRSFEKPFLCAFSDQDKVTAGGEAVFFREVPGAHDQPHVTVRGGGHFLQEDRGSELAAIIAQFVERTRGTP